MPETRKASALEQMPNEIKSAIFAALPDVRSLRCAILAGPALYRSFKTDEPNIVRQVLRGQIQRSMLEDAVTVFEAKRAEHKGWNIQHIDCLFERCHYGTNVFLQTCNLDMASELVRFHGAVQCFSRRLADQALHSAWEKYDQEAVVQAVSEDELFRIKRAYYRFELYCILFGNTKERLIDPGRKQREAFWDRFAPWEIEQIACVYEHVRLEVTSAFEQLALMVPVWTEYASITGLLTDARDEFIQGQMTRGLEHVLKIFAAGNASAEGCTLQPPRSRNEQVFDLYSIEESLNWSIDLGDPPEYLTLQEMEQDPEEASKVIKSPFCVDMDTGPESAWRWAHKDVSPDFSKRSGFVLGESQTPLRECGYVFWNQERLKEWRLFDRPWRAPDPFEILDERERQVREFGQSLHARTEDLIHKGTLNRGLWL